MFWKKTNLKSQNFGKGDRDMQKAIKMSTKKTPCLFDRNYKPLGPAILYMMLKRS